jgi:hypothetical protein
MEQFSAGLSDNSVARNSVLPVPRSEITFCVSFQQDIDCNLRVLGKTLLNIVLVFAIKSSSHES